MYMYVGVYMRTHHYLIVFPMQIYVDAHGTAQALFYHMLISSPLQGPTSISACTLSTSIATERRQGIIHVSIARIPMQSKTCDYTGIVELGAGVETSHHGVGAKLLGIYSVLVISLLAHTHTCTCIVFGLLFALCVLTNVIYKHFAFVCFVLYTLCTGGYF